MKFKEFMDKYTDWNGTTRVNDDNLNIIIEDKTRVIMDTRDDLFEKEVVAFGFYDSVMAVRVK